MKRPGAGAASATESPTTSASSAAKIFGSSSSRSIQSFLGSRLVGLFPHALFESFEARTFRIELLARPLRGRRFGRPFLAHLFRGDPHIVVGGGGLSASIQAPD